jgi:hypothetical protein
LPRKSKARDAKTSKRTKKSDSASGSALVTYVQSAPQEEGRTLKPPAFIELENLNELARLTCALERAPLPIFAIRKEDGENNRFMLSTQLDLFGGSSVFYYAFSDQVKHFLSYKTTGIGEETTLVDFPSNPTMVYAPIIEIVKLPPLFQSALDEKTAYNGPKFLSLQVKDLMSIVKVASYKVMFEEPPLPMFAFPSGSKDSTWIIGSFTRIEELEEASIFFYCEQTQRPEQNYVGYSSTRSQAFFSNKTDEHGTMYIKLVRLKSQHPLVEIY